MIYESNILMTELRLASKMIFSLERVRAKYKKVNITYIVVMINLNLREL